MASARPGSSIGVLTSGGDAPGMNAAIRAVVRVALHHGRSVVGIANGYDGLIDGNFRTLGARDVGSILQRGGTFLQTRRSARFFEARYQAEARQHLAEAGVEGLVVIGGEGSIAGAQALAQLGVKVVAVPASIDNDVAGTDYAIGVDTALNTILDAVDKLRDTASSHNRAFLIETMGRGCGYLALIAGIVCGAELVLVHVLIETPLYSEGPFTMKRARDVFDAARAWRACSRRTASARRRCSCAESISRSTRAFVPWSSTRATPTPARERKGSPAQRQAARRRRGSSAAIRNKCCRFPPAWSWKACLSSVFWRDCRPALPICAKTTGRARRRRS